ncbi:hypothetical protein [Corynebacterium sp. J010B-136]|nr:hypothetical protein [Corynebacterium sp. J010B-136]
MIETIVTALTTAFGQVADLFTGVLEGAFGAIEGLSSGIFGDAE